MTFAVAAGLAFAGLPDHLYAADENKVLTAEEVLRGKIEGQVRVQLAVEGWVRLRGAYAGPGEPQHLRLKGAMLGDERLSVLVEQKVFDRLRALGIDDPKEHFEGKTVIVAGKVHRNPVPFSGGTSIIIWVKDLDQIESISK